MHIISRKKLKEAALRRGELEVPLDAWFRIAKKSFMEESGGLRETFSNADAVGEVDRLQHQGKPLPVDRGDQL